MSAAHATEVLSPSPEQEEKLAKVLSFITAYEVKHGAAPDSTFYLSGRESEDRVELTEELHAVLKEVARSLASGKSITIVTRDQEVSTQQAADILGISRPTVVRLIDDGELKAHVPGAARRKLRLADVLAYREHIGQRRDRFIDESSAEYGDPGDVDLGVLLEEARRAH